METKPNSKPEDKKKEVVTKAVKKRMFEKPEGYQHDTPQKPKKRSFKMGAKAKDFFNPKSEYRGAGRLLQITGTDKLAKKFISMGSGGNYSDNFSDSEKESRDPNKDRLKRWFEEKWVDVKTGKPCGRKSAKDSNRDYPACRPSKRVNADTPKTSKELSNKEKSKLKKVKNSSKRIPYTHKKSEDIKGEKKSYNKNVPTNKSLYNEIKREADSKFDKPSAYKSGWIVKTYKARGGEYSTVKSDKNYSSITSTLSTLEKDNLIVNGFYDEVKLIEQCDSGKCDKTKEYYNALDKIIEFRQRAKKKDLSKNNKLEESYSSDKNYSHAWNLLCKFC
jgi:hypothetical protein